jgi:hypothetical protein
VFLSGGEFGTSGVGVGGHDTREACPGSGGLLVGPARAEYILRVVRPDGTTDQRRITINAFAGTGTPGPSATGHP